MKTVTVQFQFKGVLPEEHEDIAEGGELMEEIFYTISQGESFDDEKLILNRVSKGKSRRIITLETECVGYDILQYEDEEDK